MCRAALISGALALTFGLAACNPTAPIKPLMTSPAPKTYDLALTGSATVPARRKRLQLLINEPSAIRSLDSDKIMIRPKPERVAYYAGAAWSDRLPKVLQARIAQGFGRAGMRGVSTAGEQFNGDRELDTQIQAFQIEISGSKATAHVSLNAKVISQRRDRVLAAKDFSARVVAKSDSTANAVKALGAAMSQVVLQIVEWAAKGR